MSNFIIGQLVNPGATDAGHHHRRVILARSAQHEDRHGLVDGGRCARQFARAEESGLSGIRYAHWIVADTSIDDFAWTLTRSSSRSRTMRRCRDETAGLLCLATDCRCLPHRAHGQRPARQHSLARRSVNVRARRRWACGSSSRRSRPTSFTASGHDDVECAGRQSGSAIYAHREHDDPEHHVRSRSRSAGSPRRCCG